MSSSPVPDSGISLPLIEGALTLIAVGLAFVFPRFGSSWFARIEASLSRLARRKRLAVFVVGSAALFARLALLPWFPIPLPVLPDDFSFLLSGDTFVHGRLANLTPPMWVHFESIHINMQPTYMSMYFPGTGLFLALGQVLFGHPWYGLLIANALMCAALCWMLQAWLPPCWALLGGAIAIIRLSLFSYWINTYTGGGAIAALGGALVLGAFPRFRRNPQFGYALAMAIGAVLLAYTRPYEGMLLCLTVVAVLIHWFFKAKNRPAASILFRRTAVPLLVLVGGAAWLGYYDLRVNGNSLTLPYTINRATYAITPYYVWQKLRPEPAYHHEEMRRFYRFDELSGYENERKGFIRQTFFKAIDVLLFFGGIALIPPLFMIRRVMLDRRSRFLLAGILILAVGMTIEIYLAPHYVAPFTAAFYAIGLQAMRHLRLSSLGGNPTGVAMVRLLTTVFCILAGLRIFDQRLGFPIQSRPPVLWVSMWFGPDHFGTDRADVQRMLQNLPGMQLVLVRYSADHFPQDEWVYNAADIENSKVIWAREMNPTNNRELLDYYHDRKVWLVQPDLPEDRVLSRYPLTEGIAHDAQ